MSDHLSFNQTPEFATGFFLPPRQTIAGVSTVTRSIRDLQESLSVPVVVETGVNYLRPRSDELRDGNFVRRVSEAADCGLLLDLHNVFTNALNGRQPLDAFLDDLPLERVWEVHLAGGMELDGFWLDAHSGAIPDALYSVAEQLIPRLPNLGAIIFEIFPSFVPVVGLDLVEEQIDRLHALWRRRAPLVTQPSVAQSLPIVVSSPGVSVASQDAEMPDTWERALGSLVIGRSSNGDLLRELGADPGVKLIAGLIFEFRASMVVGTLRLTSRLLLLALGQTAFLNNSARLLPEDPAAVVRISLQAEAFDRYIRELHLEVPHLAKVLEVPSRPRSPPSATTEHEWSPSTLSRCPCSWGVG